MEWYKTGGCLLMGYEMYRLMTSRKGHIAQPKKPGRKAVGKDMVIDVDEEDKTRDMFVGKVNIHTEDKTRDMLVGKC